MSTTTPMPHCAPRTERVAPSGDERATALVLVPALMLVLLTLGAIAVDLTAMHGAHRSAHRIVSSAADDAAGMLDTRLIQQTGELRIDPAASAMVADAQVRTAQLPGTQVGPTEVTVSGDGTTVRVRVRVRIEHILLPSVPGAAESDILTVAATGRLVR